MRMNQRCLPIIILLVGYLLSMRVAAADKPSLRFSYWAEASPPFVMLDQPTKKIPETGVLKDLADQIALQLGRNTQFINLPVPRIEPFLNSGGIDIDCITQPGWKEHPETMHWSPVLFTGADRFMVKRSEGHQLSRFEDLKGKNLGIYNGYIYHPDITRMIEAGEIKTVKVTDLDHAVQLILLGRIDAMIDFDILLEYKIAAGFEDQLELADLVAETYDLYCAYSKHIGIDPTLIDGVINSLKETGAIDAIIKKYVP